MISIKNKNKFIVIIGVLFLVCSNTLSLAGWSCNASDKDLKEVNSRNKIEQLQSSTIENPIFIDDGDPNYNWSKTASENDWCNGSGSVDDPYLISGLVINGKGSNCIEIKNSYSPIFEIKDCVLFNGSSGIYLDNAKHGLLKNNTCFNNTGSGIVIYSCDYSYNTVIGNTLIENDAHGILVRLSLYNEIMHNEVHNNTNNGIYIYLFSDYNRIEGNNVTNNLNGIHLYYGSRYNDIINNTFEHNSQYGIYLHQDCEYTDIIDNRINLNSQMGIYIYLRCTGVIQDNHLESNGAYGMYIRNCVFSLYGHISFNVIINSSTGMYLLFVSYIDILNNNIYDIDGIGIHLIDSDPIIVSNNHLVGYTECIVEVSCNGNTITNNICGEDLFEENDNFNAGKLIPKGWTKYLAANDEDWYRVFLNQGETLYLIIEFLNSSGNLDLSLHDNQGTLLEDSTTETNDELIIYNITISTYYYIRVYNETNRLYSISIESEDIINPTIEIISPFENELFRVSPPQFIVEIQDLNLDKMWYVIDNCPRVEFTANSSINGDLWTSLPDGSLDLKFFANDTAGNINMKSVTIEKNALPPSITIHEPLTDEVYDATPPVFNVSISDNNLQHMWYVISNNSLQSQNVFFTDNGTINADAWDIFTDDKLNITFHANDTAGNENSSSVLVYKDTLPPQLIINSPFHYQLFGIDAPNFDLILNDANPATLWYTLNDNATLHHSSNSSGTIDRAGWDACSNGTVLIKFYFQDVAGEIAFKEVRILKDIEPPNMYFAFGPPYINNTQPQYYHDWVDVFCRINDRSGIGDVMFEIKYGHLWMFVAQTPLYNFYDDEWNHAMHISHLNWNDTVSFRFIARDLAGNVNHTQYYNFTIGDDINPQTNISFTPHVDSNHVSSSTQFYLIASDNNGSGISTIEFKINDSDWHDYGSNFNLSTHESGNYVISFHAVDNAGNVEGIKSLYVVLVEANETIPRNGIPSYDIFIIFFIICTHILIIRKKLKRVSKS